MSTIADQIAELFEKNKEIKKHNLVVDKVLATKVSHSAQKGEMISSIQKKVLETISFVLSPVNFIGKDEGPTWVEQAIIPDLFDYQEFGDLNAESGARIEKTMRQIPGLRLVQFFGEKRCLSGEGEKAEDAIYVYTETGVYIYLGYDFILSERFFMNSNQMLVAAKKALDARG